MVLFRLPKQVKLAFCGNLNITKMTQQPVSSTTRSQLDEIYLSPIDSGEKFSLEAYAISIKPENNFEEVFQTEVKRSGSTFCLNPLHRLVNNRRKIVFEKVAGVKRVYLVPHDMFELNEEEVYLNKFGLTLCKDPINYLLGLINSVEEKDMPLATKNKSILALNCTIKGIYTDWAVLGIKRKGNDRGFNLFESDHIHNMKKFEWMVLAEEV